MRGFVKLCFVAIGCLYTSYQDGPPHALREDRGPQALAQCSVPINAGVSALLAHPPPVDAIQFGSEIVGECRLSCSGMQELGF